MKMTKLWLQKCQPSQPMVTLAVGLNLIRKKVTTKASKQGQARNTTMRSTGFLGIHHRRRGMGHLEHHGRSYPRKWQWRQRPAYDGYLPCSDLIRRVETRRWNVKCCGILVPCSLALPCLSTTSTLLTIACCCCCNSVVVPWRACTGGTMVVCQPSGLPVGELSSCPTHIVVLKK